MVITGPNKLKCAFFLAFVSSSANAGLEFVSFDSNGTNKKINTSNLSYINSSGSVDFYISAGLDRRVLVQLYQQDNLVYENKTTVVNTKDRIDAENKSFYGKKVTIPTLNDGSYTLKITSLSLSNNIVSNDEYHFQRDTIAPTFSDDIKFVQAGYGKGSIEHFGNTHSTKALKLLRVADENSGISTAVYFAEPINGSRPRIEKPVNMLVEEKNADLHINAALAADPNSFPNGKYKIGFSVTDQAGNVSEKSRESFIISQCPSETVGIEVYNHSLNVWQPYVSGMLIYSNPVKVRWKRAKGNFSDNPDEPYGWDHTSMISNEDSTYNYYEREFPYPQNYSYFHFFTLSGKVCYTYHLRNLRLTPAQNVGLAPKYNGVHYTLNSAPDNWIQSAYPRYNYPYSIPKARIFAEPRPYRQKAWGSGIETCYIEIGRSSCDASTNINHTTGRGYSPRAIYLSRDDGSLSIHGGYLYTYWDYNPVKINNITHEQDNKLIKASLTDDDTVTDWRSYMWTIKKTVFKYTDNGGIEHELNATNTTIFDANNREVSLDLSNIPDGTYIFDLIVNDTYDNRSNKTINVVLDSTPPVINIKNNNQLDFDIIKDLDNVSITLNDQSETELISVRLFGSIADENVYLPIIKKIDIDGNITFGIDKPKIFPTLLDNEHYGFEIVAKDEYSNAAQMEKFFKYIPQNLITLKKQIMLPVAKNLKNSSNQSIATIYSDQPLTIEGGMLATGIQTATITNRSNSKYAINIDTADGLITVNAGETKEIKIDLGDVGSRLNVDLYPAEGDITGISSLLFDIQMLKSKWQ